MVIKMRWKNRFWGPESFLSQTVVTRNQFLMNTTVKGYKIKRTTKFKFLPSIKGRLIGSLGFFPLKVYGFFMWLDVYRMIKYKVYRNCDK